VCLVECCQHPKRNRSFSIWNGAHRIVDDRRNRAVVVGGDEQLWNLSELGKSLDEFLGQR